MFCRHNPLPTLTLCFADTTHYQHFPFVLQTQPITNTFPAFCRHSPLPTLSLRFADTAHYQHFPFVLQTQPITNTFPAFCRHSPLPTLWRRATRGQGWASTVGTWCPSPATAPSHPHSPPPTPAAPRMREASSNPSSSFSSWPRGKLCLTDSGYLTPVRQPAVIKVLSNRNPSHQNINVTHSVFKNSRNLFIFLHPVNPSKCFKQRSWMNWRDREGDKKERQRGKTKKRETERGDKKRETERGDKEGRRRGETKRVWRRGETERGDHTHTKKGGGGRQKQRETERGDKKRERGRGDKKERQRGETERMN